nr:hypothetical protein [Tanacetum cinerariifolium]
MLIPPPSPLTPLSSPLPQIPSPPLPASPPILPIPLPAASPPLQLPSSDRRVDRPEVTLPSRKRLSIVHCPGYEAGESSVVAATRPIEGRRVDYGFVDSVEAEIRRRRAEDIGYGIRDTWIDPRDIAKEEALTTLKGVNTRVTELVAVQEQDTQDIYRVMEDTQVTLTTQLSSLHGHLAMALGEIRALQAREQARASAPEGASSSATSNPNQAPSTTTTTVTNSQLQAMINQGVNAALAARDANQTEESDRVERYIGGLPDSIHGSVTASKPKTMQEATEMATGLMDKKIRTYAKRDIAEEEALTTLKGVNTKVTELAAVQEQDTQDIYGVMEDAQRRQTEMFQRVETLVDDSRYHYETGRLVDQEARCSYFELQGYMTHTWVQDQRIDAQDTLIATLTTQLSSLQGHLVTALGEIQAL